MFNHFQFIFVYGGIEYNFISFPASSQFSALLIEETIFSLLYSCLPCDGLIDRKCVGLILGSLSCSTDFCFYFLASTILFSLSSLCSLVWAQGMCFLNFSCTTVYICCLTLTTNQLVEYVMIFFFYRWRKWASKSMITFPVTVNPN